MDDWLQRLQAAGRDWVRFDQYHLSAYMRWTRRYLDGNLVNTIEIASAEVDSAKRYQGYFKRFLEHIEHIAHDCDRTVFIESILSPEFLRFFTQRGYLPVNHLPSCVFLQKS